MDFELSEEQQMFRDVLRQFVDSEIKPVARDMEQSGQYPHEIVAKMAEMGLFGITVGADYGGLDLDTVSMSLVFEEISMGWMGIAGILGSHSLSCRMIMLHGTDEQKRRWLPGVGHRRAAHRHRPHRAGRGQRPAGHLHPGLARRRGLRDQGNQDLDHQRPLRQPAAGLVKTDPDSVPRHRGMSVLMSRRARPVSKCSGIWASSATRALSRARWCSTMCESRPATCWAVRRAWGSSR